MTEDGHVQKVFSAALAMVLHSLEFLNMNPACVALGTGGGSVAAGAISSHRLGSTPASALALGGTWEHIPFQATALPTLDAPKMRNPQQPNTFDRA